MRTLNRLITTFDEVRHAKIACAIHGVEPETCTAEVSSGRSSREEAARQDPAVHVSLSSDSLVKQRGAKTIPPSGTAEPSKPKPPMLIGSLFATISEELQRRAIAPRRGARRVGGI
jgi:hypothetical protein